MSSFYLTESFMTGAFLFVIGAIVGSFLNVCIVRMPRELSIVRPGSHCVHCKHPIAWYHNIPIVSYILLKGQCPYCKTGFSFRYCAVEILTAVTFVLMYLYFGMNPVLIPYLFMVSCFIVATFVDFGHRIIPDEVSVGGMFAGLLFSCFVPDLHQESAEILGYGRLMMRVIFSIVLLYIAYQMILERVRRKEVAEESDTKMLLGIVVLCFLADWAADYLMRSHLTENTALYAAVRSFDASILGIAVGGGVIYLMGVLGDVLFRKESMGGGDIKLLAMIGAFLGWQMAVLAFFIAPFFGAVFGLIEKIRTKDSHIAYGPFLVLAALLCLFRGQEILAWIMSGYGLY